MSMGDASGWEHGDFELFGPAMAGAQVRAAETTLPTLTAHLAGGRVRAIVLVADDSVSRRAAHVAADLALTEDRAAAPPVLVADRVPAWVGALDVVVLLGSDPGSDRRLADFDAAHGRGAEVVVADPGDGPLRAVVLDAEEEHSGGSSCVLVPYAAGAIDAAAGPRALGVCLAVLTAAGALRIDLGEVADAIDADIAAASGEQSEVTEPVHRAARRLAGSTILVAAPSALGEGIADQIAAACVARGLPAASVGLAEVLRAMPAFAERAQEVETPDPDDIFFDPFLDAPPGPVPRPAAVVVPGVALDADQWARRRGPLPHEALFTVAGSSVDGGGEAIDAAASVASDPVWSEVSSWTRSGGPRSAPAPWWQDGAGALSPSAPPGIGAALADRGMGGATATSVAEHAVRLFCLAEVLAVHVARGESSDEHDEFTEAAAL